MTGGLGLGFGVEGLRDPTVQTAEALNSRRPGPIVATAEIEALNSRLPGPGTR